MVIRLLATERAKSTGFFFLAACREANAIYIRRPNVGVAAILHIQVNKR